MKSLLRFLILAAALCGVANAQLMTFETISQWDSNNRWGVNFNSANTETFHNVSAVDSMTFRFVGTNTSAVNLTAYFAEWNTTTARPVGSFLYTTSLQVPIAGSFSSSTTDVNGTSYSYFDYAINLGASGYGLDATKTYAMILTAAGTGTGATGVSLLQVVDSNPFPSPGDPVTDPFIYGAAMTRTKNPMTYTNLVSGTNYGSNAPFNGDFGFAQIAIVPAAVPEPKTAALGLAVLFVAGLVGRRLWQRRQVALQPIPITA